MMWCDLSFILHFALVYYVYSQCKIKEQTNKKKWNRRRKDKAKRMEKNKARNEGEKSKEKKWKKEKNKRKEEKRVLSWLRFCVTACEVFDVIELLQNIT